MTARNDSQMCIGALRETAHMLSGVLQEPEVVRVLLNQVVSVLPVRKAMALLLSPDCNSLLLGGSVGLSDAYLARMPVLLPESPMDQRALAGEQIVMDVAGMPGLRDSGLVQDGVHTVMIVPLMVREHAIGVLHAYFDKVILERNEPLGLLIALADLGALSIEKVRLHRSLFRIAAALNSSLDLQAMLLRVLEATVEEMSLKAASVRLLEKKPGTLRLIASYGLSEAYQTKGEIHLDKSGIDRQVLSGETVVMYDVEREPGLEYPEAVLREGIRSVLVVPMKLKARPLGVMRVYSAQPRLFSSVAVSFLQSVADLVSLAIENAELYAALQARNKDLNLDLADWRQFLALG